MKIEQKRYSFQLSEPVFNTALFVIVNCSFEQLVKKIRKLLPDFELDKKYRDSRGLSLHCEEEKTGMQYPFIWVKDFDWTIESQGVFLHELNHFVFSELRHKNMPHSENDEAHCYLFSYYMKESWAKLKRIYKLTNK